MAQIQNEKVTQGHSVKYTHESQALRVEPREGGAAERGPRDPPPQSTYVLPCWLLRIGPRLLPSPNINIPPPLSLFWGGIDSTAAHAPFRPPLHPRVHPPTHQHEPVPLHRLTPNGHTYPSRLHHISYSNIHRLFIIRHRVTPTEVTYTSILHTYSCAICNTEPAHPRDPLSNARRLALSHPFVPFRDPIDTPAPPWYGVACPHSVWVCNLSTYTERKDADKTLRPCY